jgi:hypothetical protein
MCSVQLFIFVTLSLCHSTALSLSLSLSLSVSFSRTWFTLSLVVEVVMVVVFFRGTMSYSLSSPLHSCPCCHVQPPHASQKRTTSMLQVQGA